MRTKIIIALTACLFAAVSVANMHLARNNHNLDVSLADISVMAQATGEESGGGGENWAYLAKLTAEPLYDEYITTTCGLTGWVKLLGGSFDVEHTHYSGLAGEIKNCTFWLTARCDQNKVGVFYIPDPI